MFWEKINHYEDYEDYEGPPPSSRRRSPEGGGARPRPGTDLRANLDVILLMRPVEVPRRACTSAPASCAGDAGGPLYAAPRRSRSCSPWNVLRLELPRGKRVRSRSLSGVAALMLWADGDAAGARCAGLRGRGKTRRSEPGRGGPRTRPKPRGAAPVIPVRRVRLRQRWNAVSALSSYPKRYNLGLTLNAFSKNLVPND